MGWTWTNIPVAPTRRFQRYGLPRGTESNPLNTIHSPLLGTAAQPLQGFYHWMDAPKALRWRSAARQALTAAQALAAAPASSAAYAYVLGPMDRVVEAIAQYYNACNVPWYMHRDARELYWRHVSGIPRLDMFSKVSNSVPGWYQPHYLVPVISQDSEGKIPQLARSIYHGRRGDVRRNDFVQTVGMGMSLPKLAPHTAGGEDVAADAQYLADRKADAITSAWYYEENILNTGFVAPTIWSLDLGIQHDPKAVVCGLNNALALPFNRCQFPLPADGWLLNDPHNPSFNDADKIPVGQDSWKSFRADFGIHLGDDPMRVSLGSFFYLQWLSDWVDLLFAHDPNEVATSVREMAVYTNTQWIGRATPAQIGEIIGQSSQQYAEASHRPPEIALVEAGIGAAGAALATVTYGISAIVAAAGVLTIEISLAVNGTGDGMSINSHRDDLGRYKVVLERASLGGNDGSGDDTQQPGFDVLEPPPLGKAARAAIDGLHPYVAPNGKSRLVIHHTPPAQDKGDGSDKGMGTGSKFVIGAAVLGTLAKLAGWF